MHLFRFFALLNDADKAGGGGNGGGTPPPSWNDGFAPELKTYVDTKGFKDAQSLALSYQNLEKLHGVPKERLLKLPDKDDSPEWNDVHARLGRPEKSDGYDIRLPEGATDDFKKWAQETFHGLGLSKKAGEAIAVKWGERVQAVLAQEETQRKAEGDQQLTKLKTEWGHAFDEKLKRVDAFAEKAGIGEKEFSALKSILGIDGAGKLLDGIINKFGIQLDEADFKSAGSGGRGGVGNMSPSEAKARLDQRMADQEFTKKYLNGDLDAKQEIARLHEMMAAS